MTREEALAEARRRYGPEANVFVECTRGVIALIVERVGTRPDRAGIEAGSSVGSAVTNQPSWEAAFADADRRGEGA
jgi:hypothetical protein